MVVAQREIVEGRPTKLAVIDCDIHTAPKNEKTLAKYMPERWAQHHLTFGGRSRHGAYYPRANQNAARTDSWPPNGGPPGSDLDFLREQLLAGWDMDFGVMTPLVGSSGQSILEYGAAHAHATNEWQVAEWMDPEPRMRGSIVVSYEDPDATVAEIERMAQDKRFLQVLLYARTEQPLGNRKYWPMYEACCKHDLPVAFHFGGSGGHPITGAGWPSFYFEDHCGMPAAFEAQVASYVFEGVFDRFPTLRIVLIEGAFGWLPALTWRMERAYAKLKAEVPHLKRTPAEYVRDHIWLTTQPMEEPEKPEHFARIVDRIGADKLMFATDYPHWDFDSPVEALPQWLPVDTRAAIMAENARAFYKL
jgi:predicted TIM-barrel fold metal-dependent hydrolase